jgi:hypothetical protein
MKKSILGSCIYIAGWLIGYFCITLILSGSSGKVAYGLLSGWWCTLYLGYLFQIELIAAIPLFVLYVAGSLISLFFNLNLFYHDGPDALSVSYLFIIIFQAIIFISPALINPFVIKYLRPLVCNK